MYNYNNMNSGAELNGWSQPNQQRNQPRPPQGNPVPPRNQPRPPNAQPAFGRNNNQPPKPSFGYLASPKQPQPQAQFQPQLKYSNGFANTPGGSGGIPKKTSNYAPIPRATLSPTHKRKKLKKYLLLTFLGVFILTAIAAGVFVGAGDSLFGNNDEEANVNAAPVDPSATASPTTRAPTTAAPTTPPPTTGAPTTPPPTTRAPTTAAPTTRAPTTAAPTTRAPTTAAPTTAAPTPSGEIQIFPAETRTGNNYIGIMFISQPNQATEEAFIGAADRWSLILAGSENLMQNNQLGANSETCTGNGFRIDTAIILDHLRITSDVQPIDGLFNTVGRAGPCRFTNGAIPTFGNMEFDSEDIDRLAAGGSLESVILHEMGHVLGIGTLFNFFGLSQNELANSEPNANAIQPTYIGANGVAEYRSLTGLTGRDFILLENGFTDGSLNGAGAGSVNGHWDQDDMGVELMTFRISVTTPALSAVTIEALSDFGYTIDVTRADAFSNPTNLNVVDAINEELVNDIIDPTEFLNDLE